MNHRRYDESLIVGILSGGIVTVVSNAVQFNIFGEAGGLAVVIFAMCYALLRYKKNKHQPDFEQIWEKNRKSVINSFLSVMDDDFKIMNEIFEKLESEGFNFNIDSSEITFENLRDIDYSGLKEKFDKLPHVQNIIGFITYEQYDSVYNYLKYSTMFIDFLCNQRYQKRFLESREDEAKKILKLFSDEVNNHDALKEWKRRL